MPTDPETRTRDRLDWLPPLLLAARDAARLCAVSVPTWYRLRSAGKIGPVPIRLGGRVLWRVEELTEWVRLGCPSRQEWEALKAQTNGRVR